MNNRSSFYLQAPVGNRSYAGWGRAVASEAATGLTGLEGWSVNWLASGTMSLAAALIVAVARKPSVGPKVLVPAYGCPDLISAVRYAGAEPVYVDMRDDESRMDLSIARQHAADRDDVVAIIGVDLFGIPEDWIGLRKLSDEYNVFLVQDCAQSFQTQETLRRELYGDAVVFSFGRGKPVCCLTGGALLLREASNRQPMEAVAELRRQHGEVSPGISRTMNSLYNVLLVPIVYAQLAKIMGSSLGQTRYIPLMTLRFLRSDVACVLDNAVAAYWALHRDSGDVVFDVLAPSLNNNRSEVIRIVAGVDKLSIRRRLSRLPLLVRDARSRERIVAALKRSGISSTTMYSRTLPEIVAEHDGVENCERLPAAQMFANSLLTLPLHDRLTDHDIERIGEVLVNEIS